MKFWYVAIAILIVSVVYEYSAQWGGLLLAIVVLGMLLQGEKSGALGGRSGTF